MNGADSSSPSGALSHDSTLQVKSWNEPDMVSSKKVDIWIVLSPDDVDDDDEGEYVRPGVGGLV